MAVELIWFTGDSQPDQGQYRFFPEAVVHFGASPPEDKPNCVKISGPGVADHHAKLFWSQGHYWLVNLCGLPCTVLKSDGRTVPLTILDPATEIDKGEEFQIGDWVFRIQRLDPPENPVPAPSPPVDPQLAGELRQAKEPLRRPADRAPEHPVVWQTVLRLFTNLLRYGNAEEIWRRTVDKMAEGFHHLRSDSKPVLLFALAEVYEGEDRFSPPIFKCRIPLDASLAGEQRTFAQVTGLPAGLPGTLASVAMGESEPQHLRWGRKGAAGAIHLLAGRVMREAVPVGAIALGCQWSSDFVAFPEADDKYLFAHLTSDLGQALTFLEERGKAIAFERLYDLGSAVRRYTHDEAHVIEFAEAELEDMEGCLEEKCPRHDCKDERQELSDRLKKVRTIARQVRGIARATLRFVRAHEELRGGEKAARGGLGPLEVSDCNPPVREWFEQTKGLNNDDYLCIATQFGLGESAFYANRDDVLAALRNLYFNAVRSLRRVAVVKQSYQVRLKAEMRALDDLRAGREGARYVVLTVADNGVGMSRRVASQVFQGRITESASSHGLGSQIIRWVMDQHCGLIRFASEQDCGTVVELWFPNVASEAPPPDEVQGYERIRNAVGAVAQLESHPLLEDMKNAEKRQAAHDQSGGTDESDPPGRHAGDA